MLVGLHHVGSPSIGSENTYVLVLPISVVIQNGFL